MTGVVGAGSWGGRRRPGRAGERCGDRDTAPPGGALVRAVPVEREVDVVGVRRDAVVGGPAALGRPGLPLLAVEDDVVDAEPPGHRARAALGVGGGQPPGQRVGEGQVLGLPRVDHPVQGTTLTVLGGALAQDAVGVGPVGRVEQLGEGHRTGLVLGEAAGALLVERGHVEGGRQRARRLRVGEGRGAGGGRGGREHGKRDDGGRHRTDGAHGHPALSEKGGLRCGHDGVLLGQGAPSQGVKTHQESHVTDVTSVTRDNPAPQFSHCRRGSRNRIRRITRVYFPESSVRRNFFRRFLPFCHTSCSRG